MSLWTFKYSPKSIAEVVDQEIGIKKLITCITNQKKKNVILAGPHGCGKTSSVHAIANEYNMEIVEINTSDKRNKNNLEDKLNSIAMQQSLFCKGKIILIDDIEGISARHDRGGMLELLKLIKKSPFPVIFTVDNPYTKKLAVLRRNTTIVEFQEIKPQHIKEKLTEIAKKEKIDITEFNVSNIIYGSGGDLRAAITDFQVIVETQNTKQQNDELESQRNQTLEMPLALLRIFKTTNPNTSMDSIKNISEDYKKLSLHIEQNLSREYTKKLDLKRGYDMLSLADVFNGRISRRQYWGFIKIILILLTSGISLAKDEKYKTIVKYSKFIERLSNIVDSRRKNAMKQDIITKISAKTSTSEKKIKIETYPYIKLMYEITPHNTTQISNYYEFNEKEKTYLMRK